MSKSVNIIKKDEDILLADLIESTEDHLLNYVKSFSLIVGRSEAIKKIMIAQINVICRLVHQLIDPESREEFIKVYTKSIPLTWKVFMETQNKIEADE